MHSLSNKETILFPILISRRYSRSDRSRGLEVWRSGPQEGSRAIYRRDPLHLDLWSRGGYLYIILSRARDREMDNFSPN